MFIKYRGLFLLESLIGLMMTLIVVSVLLAAVSFFVKIQSNNVHSVYKLNYIVQITNDLAINSIIACNTEQLTFTKDTDVYQLVFRNNKLVLLKNGKGTQALLNHVKSLKFWQSGSIIVCTIILENTEVLEWGVIISAE